MTDPIEDQRQCFNNWLKRTRRSTLSVATRAGINESALRHYKNGRTHDLRLENKLKIAQTHRAKLSDVFGDLPGNFAAQDAAQEIPPIMAVTIITHIDAGPIIKASINPATGKACLISAQLGDTHVQMDTAYARDLAARITQAIDFADQYAAPNTSPPQPRRQSA